MSEVIKIQNYDISGIDMLIVITILGLKAFNFIKMRLQRCFPKNNFFEEHLRTTASGALLVQTELWRLIDEIWRLHCAFI